MRGAEDIAFSAGALRDVLKSARARASLVDFIGLMDPLMAITPHFRFVCNEIQEVILSERLQPNMLLRMPPRHSKTTILQYAAAWFMGKFPKLDVLWASGRESLVDAAGQKIRDCILSPLWPFDCKLRGDSKARDNFQLDKGGKFRGVTIQASCQGENYHLGIVDDPVPGSEYATENVFTKQRDWFEADFFKRKVFGAHTIVSYFPWADGDLGWYILNHQDDDIRASWYDLALPAYARVNDPMGREPGEVLFPLHTLPDGRKAGYTREFYEMTRKLNPHRWQAQYELEPAPPGGAFFNVEHLLIESGEGTEKTFAPADQPKVCDTIFCTIDTALKTGSKNDGTAVVYCAYSRYALARVLIVDWGIFQIDGSMQVGWLARMHERGEELAQLCKARYGYSGAFIEDKASGTILLQQEQAAARVEHRRPLAHAIDSVLTSKGKDERSWVSYDYVARGLVKITQPAYDKVMPYKGRPANHLLMQIQNFRIAAADGAADDLLDCFTYATVLACGRNLTKGAI